MSTEDEPAVLSEITMDDLCTEAGEMLSRYISSQVRKAKADLTDDVGANNALLGMIEAVNGLSKAKEEAEVLASKNQAVIDETSGLLAESVRKETATFAELSRTRHDVQKIITREQELIDRLSDGKSLANTQAQQRIKELEDQIKEAKKALIENESALDVHVSARTKTLEDELKNTKEHLEWAHETQESKQEEWTERLGKSDAKIESLRNEVAGLENEVMHLKKP